MCIVGGLINGVLGLRGIPGFIFFAAMYTFVSLVLWAWMGFNLSVYSNLKLREFLFADIGSHALSFILFWTLMYAMVYIY
jgi:hypothetical protein